MKEDPEISQALLEANPQIAIILFLFGLMLLLILTGFFSLWGTTLMRWYRGAPILTIESWKPRSWGLVDVLLVLAAAIVGQALLIPIWAKLSGANLRNMIETDSMSLSVMAVGSTSYLLAMLAGIAWLFLRYQVNFKHIGLSLRRWLPNLGLGLAAAAMALPIVALVSVAVSAGLKADYDHPLINELKKEGTLSAYLLAVFCAVLVAPLVEEFFFRVLLQGWLESLQWSWRGWWWLLGANSRQTASLMSDGADSGSHAIVSPDAPGPDLYAQPVVAGLSEPPILSSAYQPSPPYQPTASLSPSIDVPAAQEIGDAKPPLWPTFVVGTLFGLAHFDYGLSFIPLILLGIVLGLLYRAKHSIWPCFVLHFALNSMSMFSLGIALLVEAAK